MVEYIRTGLGWCIIIVVQSMVPIVYDGVVYLHIIQYS